MCRTRPKSQDARHSGSSPITQALSGELDRLRTVHDRVVLYDCHSIRSIIPRLFDGLLPHFNLGTNDGASCAPELTAAVEAACDATSLSRVTNGRFKGGWITRHYGRPQAGVHAIQMELACRGYLAEPIGPCRRGNLARPFDNAYAAPMTAALSKVLQVCDRVCGRNNPRSNAMTRIDKTRTVRAPRGSTLSAKSWLTEAALRMLMNNLDAEVAERPEELVVYGGIGRAARDWESFDRIVATLRRLEDDQTLLVQSGKPVGVFRTHRDAPRVLIANSNLVPAWANWDHFHELDRKGLMMYGQMTAGSWIYIGTQGIVQGTYETFAEVARQHYRGSFAGRWILTAGLGGMGGAQPLAAVMAGASCLAVECQPSRIEMRLRTGYLDRQSTSLDEALEIINRSCRDGTPVSVGLLGNAAEIYPELVRRGVRPDAVTDQTSAHDPVNGYLPRGWTLEQWAWARVHDPKGVERAAKKSMAEQVELDAGFSQGRSADL